MSDGDRTRVTIEPATVDDIDSVTDMWVALAAGQRRYGSTLLADDNRGAVREWAARAAVTGELLVARETAAADPGDGDTDDRGGAHDNSPADPRDGDPIGFVGFGLDHGGYERDRTRGVVSNLFVAPERRGEGVGTALLCAAEDALREAGADAVALEALADNERARAFYADHGYEPHRVELTKSLSADPDRTPTDSGRTPTDADGNETGTTDDPA
ncbi:GCN5-related N-acetyltransferase [Halorubrum aidingense JCM 13560]|uniref:GCN5-related N-acetyltransferase n=1 Tax=Halorubrum aidingense JCM 13560 TaxID=1230454 RepID=M0PDL3_9EURY|nr:GNAT family N-acetyltransferase [Halorubrum aidingense]EMA67609.1 GCN5-related N-acetyltransferase [Halorubrum aidingense JCM 13560]